MNGDIVQYVLFRVGAEEYALPISRVSSIIRYEPATPVPRAPDTVDGVINLRGRVIPVVDLSRCLFGTAFAPTSRSRIVVAESEDTLVGLAVDAASEVASFPLSSVMPPPASPLIASAADVIEGVVRLDERLVILLDLDRVLPRGAYELEAAGADVSEV